VTKINEVRSDIPLLKSSNKLWHLGVTETAFCLIIIGFVETCRLTTCKLNRYKCYCSNHGWRERFLNWLYQFSDNYSLRVTWSWRNVFMSVAVQCNVLERGCHTCLDLQAVYCPQRRTTGSKYLRCNKFPSSINETRNHILMQPIFHWILDIQNQFYDKFRGRYLRSATKVPSLFVNIKFRFF